jgi:hypothetical protein
MNDWFREAMVGKLANTLGTNLRDLRRKMRARTIAANGTPYSPEQKIAADHVTVALASVEAAFASHALSFPLAYCECCTDPKFIDRLVTTPRTELSEDDVAEVVASLTLTLGTEDDVPYFVPLFCRDLLSAPLYDAELAFARIRTSFGSWPPSERTAVARFLTSQWQFLLLAPPERHASLWTTTLECFMMLDSVDVALRLIDDACEFAQHYRIRILDRFTVADEDRVIDFHSAGYDDTGDQVRLVAHWLMSEATASFIDAELVEIAKSDTQEAHRLESLRTAMRALPIRSPHEKPLPRYILPIK